MEKILGLEDSPNPAYILNEREVRLLAAFLRFQYVPHEHIELVILVRELVREADELVDNASRPTQ